ncbi:hypothetical protein D3C79_1017290 [compost metagenome]
MMPSSKPYSRVAICDSATLRPLSVGTARLGSNDNSVRSCTVPRNRISINSLSSRYWLTLEPVRELCRNVDRFAVLTPSARARS